MPIGVITDQEIANLKRALEFGYKSGQNNVEIDLVISKLNAAIAAVDGAGSGLQVGSTPAVFTYNDGSGNAATITLSNVPKVLLSAFIEDFSGSVYPISMVNGQSDGFVDGSHKRDGKVGTFACEAGFAAAVKWSLPAALEPLLTSGNQYAIVVHYLY